MAPGLPDLAAVKKVCGSLNKPFNFMVGIKGRSFTKADLEAAGVKRISLATSLYRAAMTGLLDAAQGGEGEGHLHLSRPSDPDAGSQCLHERVGQMVSLSRRRLLAPAACDPGRAPAVARASATGLARQADPHDRALSAGRRRRHGGARLLGEGRAQDRPDHRRRQPARRRRRRSAARRWRAARPTATPLMMGSMVDYSIAPYFHQNLSFDMAKDFVPILEIGNGTMGVLVTPSLPANNVQELIALAKSKPGQLSYCLVGLRRPDPSQLRDAEADDRRGDDPRALQGHQLLPGRSLRGPRAGLDRQRAGPSAAHRLGQGALPRRHQPRRARRCCPTCRPWPEAGVPGFESATNYTLFAPKARVGRYRQKLNETGNEVIGDADFRERMLKLGIVTVGGPQAEVQAKMPTEMKRWADVIVKGNIKPSWNRCSTVGGSSRPASSSPPSAWALGLFGSSVYLQAVTAAHGWPIAEVASAITLFFLVSALVQRASSAAASTAGGRGRCCRWAPSRCAWAWR